MLKLVTEKTRYDLIAIDVLARTLWGEMRSADYIAMEALACTIMNREAIAQSLGKYWWGNNIVGICQKPWQFSCWNRSSPEYKKLLTVDSNDPKFVDAWILAELAVHGRLSDITGGATHCVKDTAFKPSWTKGLNPEFEIDGYLYYKP